MSLTFSMAREKILARLDSALDELKKLARDPKWSNPTYKGFTEAEEAIKSSLGDLWRLNEVESTVMRK